MACQNSYRASDLGFYPRHSCSSAWSICSWSGCSAGWRCSRAATSPKMWRSWYCGTRSSVVGGVGSPGERHRAALRAGRDTLSRPDAATLSKPMRRCSPRREKRRLTCPALSRRVLTPVKTVHEPWTQGAPQAQSNFRNSSASMPMIARMFRGTDRRASRTRKHPTITDAQRRAGRLPGVMANRTGSASSAHINSPASRACRRRSPGNGDGQRPNPNLLLTIPGGFV